MTDLATTANSTASRTRPRRRPAVATLAIGVFGGAALGVTARAWMRFIAEDPEFTWTGTMFIVIGFTVFGFTQSVVATTRLRTNRRWLLTSARTFGVIGMLPLFVAAGSMVLATVVGAGLAIARSDWRRWVRGICFALATAPVLLVGRQLLDSFGWSIHAAAGFLGLLAIYAAIIATTRWTFAPQPDGWRLPRWTRISGAILLGLFLAWLMAGVALR